MTEFIFPKPANENTFEDMVCDIFSYEFDNPNLQRYGRKGQKQDGLDIVGKDYTEGSLVGIQCKNHPGKTSSSKLIAEVNDTIKKFRESKLKIKKIYFITSAENDKDTQDHIIKLNTAKAKGHIYIEIIFWDGLMKNIAKHPHLQYKYFTKHLPTEKSSTLVIPDLNSAHRKTLKITYKNLIDSKNAIQVKKTLIAKIKHEKLHVRRGKRYNLYIGVSTRKDINFDGNVDINIDFSELFSDEKKLEEKFQKMVNAIKGLGQLITDKEFSKEVMFYTDAEISLNFLLGRMLRKHHIDLKIKFGSQIWTPNEELIPYVPSGLSEDIPILSKGDKAGILILEIRPKAGEKIKNAVMANLENLKIIPKVVLSHGITGGKILDSAHAYSVAEEMSKKIIQLEAWGCKDIHLFLVIAKPLATLIAHRLNATINTNMHLYFFDSDRKKYLLSGIINNKTF